MRFAVAAAVAVMLLLICSSPPHQSGVVVHLAADGLFLAYVLLQNWQTVNMGLPWTDALLVAAALADAVGQISADPAAQTIAAVLFVGVLLLSAAGPGTPNKLVPAQEAAPPQEGRLLPRVPVPVPVPNPGPATTLGTASATARAKANVDDYGDGAETENDDGDGDVGRAKKWWVSEMASLPGFSKIKRKHSGLPGLMSLPLRMGGMW